MLESMERPKSEYEINSTMTLLPIHNLPRLHTTPLACVRVERTSVIVTADNELEQRIQFVLRPYQALRMTTADCFMAPSGTNIIPNVVCEVMDSEWILELKHVLSTTDEAATFLNNAHHYLFPLQDDFLEVVAWSIFAADAVGHGTT